jgi:hypothetical protein
MRNLVLVKHGDMNPRDLFAIGEHLRAMAPGVRTWITSDERKYLFYPFLALHPTVTISFVRLKRFKPWRGRVLTGQWLRKSEEYAILDAAGIPVPRWRLVQNEKTPDLKDFPRYVVLKPDGGARGAEVKIVRTCKVRFRPWTTDAGVQSDAMIAQEFVYTGHWPESYRVTTFLGKTLWVNRLTMLPTQDPIIPEEDGTVRNWSGRAITSASKGKSRVRIIQGEAELESLAERAHAAFPGIPLLGVDIVRNPLTGQSFVLEVNASGWVWHLSSRRGLGPAGSEGFTPEFYSATLKKAASILANELTGLYS